MRSRVESLSLRECKRLRSYCGLQTLNLKGKAGEEPFSRAVYVPFYSNKVKDKQDKQDKIKSKIYLRANSGQNFHGSKKMKQTEDTHYQIIISRELLPCVSFCFLSS